MTLHQLLADLAEQGVKVWAEGDQLRIQAKKGVLTPELRHSLTQHKAKILTALHQHGQSASSVALSPIQPSPEQRYDPFPMTDLQHAFWVGRMGVLEQGRVANHGYYEIEGPDLNLDRLNWALQQLIERHDMLRAVMLPEGQQQVLAQAPPYHIEVFDLRKQTDSAVQQQIAAIRQRMSHQVLPTEQWPLFEFCATQLPQERVRLHISYDLQVFDAWSLFRLFDEWFQLYQNPETLLAPLELSFRDYVLAEQALQDTPLYRQSQKYWLGRLEHLFPAPDLPLTQSLSTLDQHHCHRWSGQLDQALWQALKQRAFQVGITPSGALLAAFAEILTYWSQSPCFTLNLALFNRLPLHPQVNDILGDFTSVTLLGIDNSATESFTARANRLQRQLLKDLETPLLQWGAGNTRTESQAGQCSQRHACRVY